MKVSKKLARQIDEMYAVKKDKSVDDINKNTASYRKFFEREVKREEKIRAETTKYFSKNKERIINRLLDTNAIYMKKYGENKKFKDLTKKEQNSIVKKARKDFGKVVAETKAARIISNTKRVRASQIVKDTGNRKYFRVEAERQQETILNKLKKSKDYSKIKELAGLPRNRKITNEELKYQSGHHYKLDGSIYREYRYKNPKTGEEVVVLFSDYDPKGEGDTNTIIMNGIDFENMAEDMGLKYAKNKKFS